MQLFHLEKWWSSSMGRMTSHIWNGKSSSHVWNHQPENSFFNVWPYRIVTLHKIPIQRRTWPFASRAVAQSVSGSTSSATWPDIPRLTSQGQITGTLNPKNTSCNLLLISIEWFFSIKKTPVTMEWCVFPLKTPWIFWCSPSSVGLTVPKKPTSLMAQAQPGESNSHTQVELLGTTRHSPSDSWRLDLLHIFKSIIYHHLPPNHRLPSSTIFMPSSTIFVPPLYHLHLTSKLFETVPPFASHPVQPVQPVQSARVPRVSCRASTESASFWFGCTSVAMAALEKTRYQNDRKKMAVEFTW